MDAVDLRRRLHAAPRASNDEADTAALIRDTLAKEGLHPDAEGVGGHGLVYVLGEGEPRRLWRADLDALSSGHRCGHDGHMAMLAGALASLAKQSFPGSITFLFQPAEETGEGMARCLRHPLVEGPFAEAIAIHNVPGAPLGQVILGPGALASAGLRMRLYGQEAHAAEPNAPGDVWPRVVSLVQMARGLQLPGGASTVVHVRLGDEAYGIRPGRATVAATLRGSDAQVATMQAQLSAEADDSEVVEPFPEATNDPDVLARIGEACRAAGLDVVSSDDPFPWSEDFAHAINRWPGALIGLGAGHDQPVLHDQAFEFPDGLVPLGIRFWEALI